MRYGLFIGINQYKNGITPLKCARNDALALSKLFALNGYDVDLLLDEEASATNIRKKLRSLGEKLQKDDFLLFYFSGHGCEVHKNHVLIGQAAYPDGIREGEESVALDRVRELTDIPGVNRLFILDCCRNDLHGGKGLEVCPGSRDLALSQISKFRYESNRILHPLIMTSCSTGERAYEDEEKGRGYFTQILEESLKNRAVRTFPAFRKAIAEEMKKLQQLLNRKQTLCWHGNVDAWDDFLLLDSWKERNDFRKDPAPSPEEAQDELLSPGERLQFNDTLFSLRNSCGILREQDSTQSMKKSLEAVQERLEELAGERQTLPALQSLQNLQKDIQRLEELFSKYQTLQEKANRLAEEEKELEGVENFPEQEIAQCKEKLHYTLEKDDVEVAGKILNTLESLLGKAREENRSKPIAGLKAAIKEAEKQLARPSESIRSNFGYMKKFKEAEVAGDYDKMEKLLQLILKNDQDELAAQAEALKSIQELKEGLRKFEKILQEKKLNIPEAAVELQENAKKCYDAKKYVESEKQLRSAAELLQSIENEYDSAKEVQEEAQKLERSFAYYSLPFPEEMIPLREKAHLSFDQGKYLEARQQWQKVIDILVKENSKYAETRKAIREAQELENHLKSQKAPIPAELLQLREETGKALQAGNFSDVKKYRTLLLEQLREIGELLRNLKEAREKTIFLLEFFQTRNLPVPQAALSAREKAFAQFSAGDFAASAENFRLASQVLTEHTLAYKRLKARILLLFLLLALSGITAIAGGFFNNFFLVFLGILFIITLSAMLIVVRISGRIALLKGTEFPPDPKKK